MSWLGSVLAGVCACAPARRLLGSVLILVLGGAMAGCSTGGQNMNAFAQAGGGPTLAFESIDGPPPAVFDRLVAALNVEAQGKPVTIVSREAPAAYHIRSYLSAHVQGGRSVIAWAFDVYDRDQQRALRLTGEEAAGKAGRDAWAAADDRVVRRIAQAGLDGVTAYLAGGESVPAAAPAPTPPVPTDGPAIASAEDPPAGTAARTDIALGFTTR